MVGLACLEFVRTLLGIDYVVRMLRILFTLLRHVGIMGVFFTHHSLTSVNREGIHGAEKSDQMATDLHNTRLS